MRTYDCASLLLSRPVFVFEIGGKIKNCALQFPPRGLKYKKRISSTIWNQLGQYENKQSQKREFLFFFSPVATDTDEPNQPCIKNSFAFLLSRSRSRLPPFLHGEHVIGYKKLDWKAAGIQLGSTLKALAPQTGSLTTTALTPCLLD